MFSYGSRCSDETNPPSSTRIWDSGTRRGSVVPDSAVPHLRGGVFVVFKSQSTSVLAALWIFMLALTYSLLAIEVWEWFS